MEKELSILMADLTGYTAMTEAHGAKAAACIIEKYISIVKKSLIGSSRLMERVGDQVMIISESPDDIALSIIKLYTNSLSEPHFLPIHAGLHHGLVFEHYGSLYGSTVNMAARMAADAGKGKILASVDFITALKHPELFTFTSLGYRHYKNMQNAVKVFELQSYNNSISNSMIIDPVCHMQLSEQETTFVHTFGKNRYQFCSEACLDAFRTYHEQLVIN